MAVPQGQPPHPFCSKHIYQVFSSKIMGQIGTSKHCMDHTFVVVRGNSVGRVKEKKWKGRVGNGNLERH